VQLTIDELNKLSKLALLAAQQAGKYIQSVDRTLLETHFKAVGSSESAQVVTEVDFTCQEIILDILQVSVEKYDLAVLSEENSNEEYAHFHSRLHKDYFWCIDPLDGTLPFIEGGDGYAVSIALVNKFGQSEVAAIHHPTNNTSYHTLIDKNGVSRCYKNGLLLVENSDQNRSMAMPKKELTVQAFTFYTDRSFVDHFQYSLLVKELVKLAKALGYEKFEIKSDGGAVINAVSVITTHNDGASCYIKLPKTQLGGGSLWDFSATACLAEATNSWCSDINGDALDLNRPDSTYMNHRGIIFASNNELANRIIYLCKDII